MHEPEDLELVHRTADGDHRAFQLLVERYQSKVYTVAFGIVRNPDAAMDVTQDAFVKAYKNIGGFRGQSKFYTWLYRIVVNLCIDRKRKDRRRAEVDFDDRIRHDPHALSNGPTLASALEGPARAMARSELREHMGRALEALSEGHREILVLREVEGLSYEELAGTLDIPKGTVMSRLFHARKNFQRALAPYLNA